MTLIVKIYHILLLLFTFSLSSCETSSDEMWEPLEFSGPGPMMLADPHIMLYDSTYYAYGTSNSNGIEVYYSKDLREWTKHKRLALDKADAFGEHSFWAPEVYYIPAKGKFYMCYSAEQKICIAEASTPLGPFTQIEKKSLFEFSAIDNTLFFDSNRIYMYFSQMRTDGEDIWCVEINPVNLDPIPNTLTKCISPHLPWETIGGNINEGPFVLKYNDIYYLLYSGNSYTSQSYGVGFAISESPMGPWKKISDQPILQFPTFNRQILFGTGHGSAFQDINGNWKYVFHAHKSETAVHTRHTYISDIKFINNDVLIPNIEQNIFQPFVIKID